MTRPRRPCPETETLKNISRPRRFTKTIRKLAIYIWGCWTKTKPTSWWGQAKRCMFNFKIASDTRREGFEKPRANCTTGLLPDRPDHLNANRLAETLRPSSAVVRSFVHHKLSNSYNWRMIWLGIIKFFSDIHTDLAYICIAYDVTSYFSLATNLITSWNCQNRASCRIPQPTQFANGQFEISRQKRHRNHRVGVGLILRPQFAGDKRNPVPLNLKL